MKRIIRNMGMRTMMMLIALLCCLIEARAVEVQVGFVDADNTADSYALPIQLQFNYSYTQQIFTAAEMGRKKGTIKSITLWLAGKEALPEMVFDIYMKEVEKEHFTNYDDFELLADDNKVYSGKLTVHNTSFQAYTFQLTTPFEYTGNGSLLVAFNNKTGTFEFGLRGKAFMIKDDMLRSVCAYTDEREYNPAEPITWDYIDDSNEGRNVIRFNITTPVTSASVLLSDNPEYSDNGKYIPLSSSDTYSYTQQIYTAEEIGTFGTIKSFMLWLKGNSASTQMPIDIYMKEVEREQWTNERESNWVTVTEDDKVFSGTLMVNNSDERPYRFLLQKTFNYSGTKNLLVAFNKKGGSWSGLKGKTFNRGDSKRRTLYAYRSSGGEYNLSAPAVNGYTTADRNAIQFEILTSDEVTIGSPNGTSAFVPTAPNYNYSLTQQIYTKEELGAAATFQSIAFCSGGNSSSCTRNLDVYMVNTKKSSFSSKDEWATVTKGDLVFSGQVTFTPNSWTTLQLTTPFEYDGKGNVLLAIDDNTGNRSGSYSFVTSSAKNLTLCYYNYSNNPDPASPPTGVKIAHKNQIKLVRSKAPTVMKPQHLRVTDLTTSSAVVGWDGEGDGFNIQYGVDGSMSTNTSWIGGNSNEHSWELDNLFSNTTYTMRVQTHIDDIRSEWASITFTTKEFIRGDVNGDGKVTPADAIMILYRYFDVEQTGFNEVAADMNGDGNISPADAIEALYIYFGAGSSARAVRPRADNTEPE